jgi:malate dehydrogenase (oxaloacetate-decarboxylating)
MVTEGLSDAQARAQIFMVDRFGLLTEGMHNLMDFQHKLMQPLSAIKDWNLQQDSEYATLFDVINNVNAGVLIGVSGKPGLFTEGVVRRMHETCPRPIILPLSNPSRQVEAHPAQVLQWTDGNAIVATGSPFGNVDCNGKTYAIAQCNNSYIFPGIGLGVIACKSARVTDEMLMIASITLSENAPQVDDNSASILPPLTDLPQISRKIAFAVAKMAMSQGHAREIPDEELLEIIEHNFWTPAYREYRRIAARAR